MCSSAISLIILMNFIDIKGARELHFKLNQPVYSKIVRFQHHCNVCGNGLLKVIACSFSVVLLGGYISTKWHGGWIRVW